MNTLHRLALTALLVLFAATAVAEETSPASAAYLRCEYRVDPLGIDVVQPRLSWEMCDARRGAAQRAYQVLVASTPEKLTAGEGDLWDSGRVASDRTSQIVYGGRALASRTVCHWKVRLWDAADRPTVYSKPATWSMGLLLPDDVKGQWIGRKDSAVYPGEQKNGGVLGCPLVRKEFTLDKPVRRATLYASALGTFQLSINGRRVGTDYFSPGWTDYRKRVYYNAYDVTALVRGRAANAIGGVIGAGWYAGAIGWKRDRSNYGVHPRLFAQLEIEAEDGTLSTVATDASWKTGWGPYLEGEFLHGETYDARRELPGWNLPGFDDAKWAAVAVDRLGAGVAFQAQPCELVEATGCVKPVKITEQKPGVFVVDMGQNFAGVARLKVRGPAGTRVTLRFAERLNPDGSIYTTNLRGARATDVYVLKGEGEEVFQPAFTFHGFQYVEATGYPGKLTDEAITGVALNSATPLVGSFECSSPMVNKLYSNVVWTQRANFISIPTDCPQRDERLGWTGDAQVFVRAATYNADVAAFFTKWMVDLEDAQRADGAIPDVVPYVLGLGFGTAAWADAGTIVPWTIDHVYDDRRLLEKHYGMMVRWVDYCRRTSKGLLRPAEGYGDWLSINAETPKDLLGTAYFAFSAKLAAQAARRLGKEDDAKRLDALFADVRAAFNRAYVAQDGRLKGNTQTGYVLALYFDLLSPEMRRAAAAHLAADIRARQTHLSTGFNGTGVLMPVLAQTGNQDIAYQLLLNDTYPSWGYSIKHGATSIWERWDGWTAEKGFQDPGMNSFAHYSFGAVARWMFQSVAGIDTDGPGYRRLFLRPLPSARLSRVKAGYRSPSGRIESAWSTEGGKFAWDVAVPANTTATIAVPAAGRAGVFEGDKLADAADGVTFLREEPGAVVYEVKAGKYRFTVR